jgi:hypothetical protein
MGLLMNTESLLELELAGGTEVIEGNLPQYHFVHHKSNVTSPGIEPEPQLWGAGD